MMLEMGLVHDNISLVHSVDSARFLQSTMTANTCRMIQLLLLLIITKRDVHLYRFSTKVVSHCGTAYSNLDKIN